MSAAVACGAAFGLGLLVLARQWATRLEPLAVAFVRLDTESTAPQLAGDTAARVGAALVAVAAGMGLSFSAARRDLAVTGGSVERYLADKALAAIVGVVLAPVTAAVAAAGGVAVPWVVPLWGSLALGAGGFVVPDLLLSAHAARRRREFRHVLGAFVDLVVIALAGGAGVEESLAQAAEVGGGWAFAALRGSLAAAQLRGEPPWSALGRLGAEVGVGELVELASSVGLAGLEGARVRASLAAKVRSLRTHELAEAEAEAASATERMSLPTVVLFVGFVVFIGFPAIERVLHGI